MPQFTLSPHESTLSRSCLFPLVHSKPLPHPDVYELFSRVASPAKPSFLLESGKGTAAIARYSFFGTAPYLVFSGKNDGYEIRTQHTVVQKSGDPFSALIALLQPSLITRPPNLPPFLGGAVGFFSYDLIRRFEHLPEVAKDDLQLPDLKFLFVDLLAAVDHGTHTLHLIFTPPPERLLTESHDNLYREGEERLAEFADLLSRPRKHRNGTDFSISPNAIQADQSRSDYVQHVLECQSFIGAGDIYQANLSHRFTIQVKDHHEGTLQESAHLLYQRLRKVNPSPFSALLDLGEVALVSSSPERLVCLQGPRAETRPIAGTRPRGRTPSEDQDLVGSLLTSRKERAEHLMLVDLARNDLGRVCRYGTVKVDEFMAVEQYSHVAHLVSNVSGFLREPLKGNDLIQAIFPGGSITGVPKIRCMEIIEHLEPVRRGPYTGSIGYLSWTGDIDLNIVIRTLLLTPQHGYIQVGAGIVADSDPEREFEETMYKAQALFQALQ